MNHKKQLKEIEKRFADYKEPYLTQEQEQYLFTRVRVLTEALENIKFNRGSTAESTNSDNYAIARKALEDS